MNSQVLRWIFLTSALSVCFLSMLVTSPTRAAQVSIQFSTTISFDSGLEVAAGNVTAGDVIGSLYGPAFGAAGQLPLTGSLTYESDTAPFQEGTSTAQAIELAGKLPHPLIIVEGARDRK